MKNESGIRLSVIVPHFNSLDTLIKLLDTIPNYPQIEVIVVDDHSTEKVEELTQYMHKYANNNVCFYNNEVGKKGAGAARNTGIKWAKGEYLLFADADDWFLPDFWNLIGEYVCDDGADLIYFAPISQKINGEYSDRSLHYSQLVNNYLNNQNYQNELKLRYLYWSPCSKLVKHSLVLDNFIYFDETPFSNDLMFSVQVGHLAKVIRASNKSIYCILEHSGSLTTFSDETALKIRQKVYCQYYFYIRRNLSWKNFKLLGFGLRSDYAQIKVLISVLLNEHRLIYKKKEE